MSEFTCELIFNTNYYSINNIEKRFLFVGNILYIVVLFPFGRPTHDGSNQSHPDRVSTIMTEMCFHLIRFFPFIFVFHYILLFSFPSFLLIFPFSANDFHSSLGHRKLLTNECVQMTCMTSHARQWITRNSSSGVHLIKTQQRNLGKMREKWKSFQQIVLQMEQLYIIQNFVKDK